MRCLPIQFHQTDNGIENISKGVRLSECSRDVFFDSTHASTNSGLAVRAGYTSPGGLGFSTYYNGSATHTFKQEFYGDGIVFNYWESSSTYRQQTFKLYIDDTLLTASNFSGVTVTSPYFNYDSSNGTFTQVNYVAGQYYVSIKGLTLGHHTLKYTHDATNDTHQGKLSSFDIATPIHTSSHYQSFETPYLHELVGGDRNMEQTNLVCSSDGKTWDEVTRDTSYIGKTVLGARTDIGSGYKFTDTDVIWDEWRGIQDTLPCHNKDWAIAYDRLICLKDGGYTVTVLTLHSSNARNLLKINGNAVATLHETGASDSGTLHVSYYFKRGDYVQVYDEVYDNEFTHIQISRH